MGARDTAFEMGFCLYGNELDETTTLQAGLGWITKFVDGNDFIGRKALEAGKAAGVTRKLCGFTMIDKGIPRQGYEILNENHEKIGQVTSGTISPVLKVGIGLGYVKPEYAKPGTPIYINIRNKPVKAEVVKPPFRK